MPTVSDLRPARLALAALAIVSAETAQAHPHVFVDARAAFLVTDEGQLHALRISWTYDAFTTLRLFETLDLDRDGDGALDDADRAAIVAGETDWPPEYKGDTWLELGGAPRPLTRPENASALMEDERITVTFDLPLETPADLAGLEAILRLYDPIFYYAYTIHPAAGLAPDLPGTCTTRIVPFEPDETTFALKEKLSALSREETPEDENVGRLFTDELHLSCR
ncbi:DUF1007 family protein [Roseovarius sp. SCSIO 43702]|uniref:DUF1007 family protein n=1 Tax=Roseovarius sp. SCSIO 43702 TaxID=2823043 RepID=UPI001C732A1D|nr:DUF1007 family protein [Roseovarius sp. SCSIO 43702]QYX56465.1 DUF1007 family protein [Roseovarius sp. SCSIO 43702]